MGTLEGFPCPPAMARDRRSRSAPHAVGGPRWLAARRTIIGSVLSALFVPASVMAEPPTTIDLRWEAPQGCPQESDVRNRIQKILGSGRHDSPLRAEGTITRIDGRFQLELVVHVGDVAGTRSIAAKSCEDLAGAAAVEIGLLVHSVEAASKPDQTGTLPSTPPVSGPETSGSSSDETNGSSSRGRNDASRAARATDSERTEREAEVESEAEEQPLPPEPPRSWHALVQAPLLALGVGPLPPLAMGAGLSLGFEQAHWQLLLRGLYWRRQNVPATGLPGYGADVDRMGATLAVCREFRLSSFGLSPCLAAGMERVSASGTGSNILPSLRHTIGMSAGAGLQGRLYLARWLRLVAAVAGEVELVRPELSISGLGPIAPPARDAEPPDPPTPVYRFASAALVATLGLEWAL
jgi:hypothetical protein